MGITKNNLLFRIFYAMFAGAMLLAFYHIKIEFKASEWVYYTVISFLLYLGLILLFYAAISRINFARDKYCGVIILCAVIVLGILLRWTAIHFFQNEQISDFARPIRFYHNGYVYTEKVPWNQRDGNQIYYAQFPAWFPYLRLVMLIFNLLGENALWLQIMNILLGVASTIIIYFLTTEKKTALMAALLFTLNPSLICYSCISTPDHITILLFLLILLFWSRLEHYRQDHPWNRNTLLFSGALILCCTLVNWFKPLSIFFVVAFICYEVAVYLYPALRKKMQLKKLWHNILCYELAFLSVLLITISAGNVLLTNRVESVIKTDVINSTGMYLFWGYSVDENGNYAPSCATNVLVELQKHYDNDLQKVYADIDYLAKEQIRNNFSLLPKIFYQKYRSAVGCDYDFFAIANSSPDSTYAQSVYNTLMYPIVAATEVHTRTWYLISALYAILAILRKKTDKQTFLASLIIFGYLLVLVLGGTQARYKSLVIPLWCFVSAYAICAFLESICQMRKPSLLEVSYSQALEKEQNL